MINSPFMYFSKLDRFIKNTLIESGYGKNNPKVDVWVSMLRKEGFKFNSYSIEILCKYGGLYINSKSDDLHNGVQLWIDPIMAASGEYDRMKLYNSLCQEELSPIGLCFDWIVFVTQNKKVYLGDSKTFYYYGASFEEFLFNIFNKAGTRTVLYDASIR